MLGLEHLRILLHEKRFSPSLGQLAFLFAGSISRRAGSWLSSLDGFDAAALAALFIIVILAWVICHDWGLHGM
jgi:hypothetical protein